MISKTHGHHIASRVTHSNCPECRADTSRRFARTVPFRYQYVSEYLSWVKPRMEAIRTGANGGVMAEAWLSDFRRALHNRINSHIPGRNGRKHAPDYAQYHLRTYGNDWHFLNT